MKITAINTPSEAAIQNFNEFRRVIVAKALADGRLKPPKENKNPGA